MARVNRLVVNTFKGKALAIIRPSGSGSIKFVAESQGLKKGELIIQVKNDFLIIRIKRNSLFL